MRSPILFLPLVAVGFTQAKTIRGIGTCGTIPRRDGTAWSASSSGTTASLSGVWGNSSSDVWAVGQNGTILHYPL